jgi:hypothetical protein
VRGWTIRTGRHQFRMVFQDGYKLLIEHHASPLCYCYYIIFIIGHFRRFHHHFRGHTGYDSEKMLPAASSHRFLDGWTVRTVFFRTILIRLAQILAQECEARQNQSLPPAP